MTFSTAVTCGLMYCLKFVSVSMVSSSGPNANSTADITIGFPEHEHPQNGEHSSASLPWSDAGLQTEISAFRLSTLLTDIVGP